MFTYFWLRWVLVAAHRLPLVVVNGGYSLVAVSGLLIAVASLAMEHRLWGAWASVAVAQGLPYNEVLLSQKRECSKDTCSSMDEP